MRFLTVSKWQGVIFYCIKQVNSGTARAVLLTIVYFNSHNAIFSQIATLATIKYNARFYINWKLYTLVSMWCLPNQSIALKNVLNPVAKCSMNPTGSSWKYHLETFSHSLVLIMFSLHFFSPSKTSFVDSPNCPHVSSSTPRQSLLCCSLVSSTSASATTCSMDTEARSASATVSLHNTGDVSNRRKITVSSRKDISTLISSMYIFTLDINLVDHRNSVFWGWPCVRSV